MKFAVRALSVLGAAVLAVTLAGLLAPRAVHAVVATLVEVTNTSANPVPTVAQGTTTVAGTVGIDPSNNTVQMTTAPENPARQPFAWTGLLAIYNGNTVGETTFAVPANQELVIEYVSTYFQTTTSQPVQWVEIDSQNVANGPLNSIFFPSTYATGTGYFVGSNQTRIYVAGGSSPTVQIWRNGSSGASYGSIGISGYLVNLP